MKDLIVKIENKDGILVVSSRVIAEQLGKRHSDVLSQLESLLENENTRSLIISSAYRVEGQNREYKEYLLTEKGFNLYMFNIQGYVDFKLAYINEFDRMRSFIEKKQLSVEEMVIMQAQSVMALKDEVKIMKEDVEELKQISSTTTIESYKQGIVQREVAKRVYDRLDKNPNIDTRKMFANIHRDLKRKFGVPSYKDIRKVDYEDALVFIHSWIEDRY